MSVKKVFSIHFPENKVYIESTSTTIEERIENIKNDKDHVLYRFFNPEIREEDSVSKKEVADKYLYKGYRIMNVNVLPPKTNLFNQYIKWKIF